MKKWIVVFIIWPFMDLSLTVNAQVFRGDGLKIVQTEISRDKNTSYEFLLPINETDIYGLKLVDDIYYILKYDTALTRIDSTLSRFSAIPRGSKIISIEEFGGELLIHYIREELSVRSYSLFYIVIDHNDFGLVIPPTKLSSIHENDYYSFKFSPDREKCLFIKQNGPKTNVELREMYDDFEYEASYVLNFPKHAIFNDHSISIDNSGVVFVEVLLIDQDSVEGTMKVDRTMIRFDEFGTSEQLYNLEISKYEIESGYCFLKSNGNVCFTGVYYDDFIENRYHFLPTFGLFLVEYDRNTGEIISEKFWTLEKGDMRITIPGKEDSWKSKIYNKKDDLYCITIVRGVEELSDKSLIVIGERTWFSDRDYYGFLKENQFNQTYLYDEMIFKLDSNFKLQWFKKIEKAQHSNKEQNYMSSLAGQNKHNLSTYVRVGSDIHFFFIARGYSMQSKDTLTYNEYLSSNLFHSKLSLDDGKCVTQSLGIISKKGYLPVFSEFKTVHNKRIFITSRFNKYYRLGVISINKEF